MGSPAQLITLPGYPFERQRHWIEHSQTTWTGDTAATNGAAAASTGGAEAAQAAKSGKSPMEATLQRIWSQCLGLPDVQRNANFFELGGDSLVAISVAMTASNEGLDLTPQDLYENQTVAALAKALTARYAAGGLARQSPGDVTHPPVPPNISYFLEHGVREHEQWRVPLILQLRPDVQVDDVCAVLTGCAITTRRCVCDSSNAQAPGSR